MQLECSLLMQGNSPRARATESPRGGPRRVEFADAAAEQPSAAQPSAGQPSAVQPSAGQPSAVQLSAVQPSAARPDSSSPSGLMQLPAGQPLQVWVQMHMPCAHMCTVWSATCTCLVDVCVQSAPIHAQALWTYVCSLHEYMHRPCGRMCTVCTATCTGLLDVCVQSGVLHAQAL